MKQKACLWKHFLLCHRDKQPFTLDLTFCFTHGQEVPSVRMSPCVSCLGREKEDATHPESEGGEIKKLKHTKTLATSVQRVLL